MDLIGDVFSKIINLFTSKQVKLPSDKLSITIKVVESKSLLVLLQSMVSSLVREKLNIFVFKVEGCDISQGSITEIALLNHLISISKQVELDKS